MNDKLLKFSRDQWEHWQPVVRESLARSGFEKAAIDWICRDMVVRWQRLPPSNEGAVFVTMAEHAAEVQMAADAVQAANNEKLEAFAHIVLDLEIDLYYAINPPSGGTRLRLVA